MLFDLVKAAFLGIVEGLTEYIPVSSTGHLLLLEHFFGFGDEEFGNTFAVLIQLGAILALLSIYFTKLLAIATGMFTDPKARRFVIGVLVAFLPAAIVGAAAHNFIKTVLFNPWIVCVSLIVGAGVLFYVDCLALKPRYHDAMTFSLPTYLGIGTCQCFAMIPGVSRSGATIVSARQPLGATRHLDGARQDSDGLWAAWVRGSRRADELRNRSGGHVSSSRRLYRHHPQGLQAHRSAGSAVDPVRVRHQSADGEDARHRRAGNPVGHRRSGDRMIKRREFIAVAPGEVRERGMKM